MATVNVALTDLEPVMKRWVTPKENIQLRSPIPRGIITFDGSGAVAAKSMGDVTNLTITLTMPAGAVYLPRTMNSRFQSDDLVNRFNDNGFVEYTRTGRASPIFNLISPGEFINSAILANRIWVPGIGSPKVLLSGGDTIGLMMADMHASASTAGDGLWYCELYVFEIDQVDKWEVNTPIPTIAHTSF